MSAIVRFAPSPTGYLHIGNLRPALFNWLFAKREGGQFVLRYDDTDAERSRREFADAILEDLSWIGIAPDIVVRQSDRLPLYDSAVEQLKADGLLYPCFETPDELDRRRKRAMARGLPPIYGREALRLSPDERDTLVAEGRRPHWRFKLPNASDDPFQPQRTDIQWEDLVRGPQSIDLASLSDPVLVREDGSYLYTLPSVVDDGEMGITHVIRGDDHLTNTGVQLAIFDALGYARPAFGHLNLLTTIDGEGLSKRSGALSLRTLRADGFEPMAVASLAVLTGASGEIHAMPDLEALGERAELTATSASNAKFDPAELDRLNADLVHTLDADRVDERLTQYGVPQQDHAAFWHAVRANCVRVRDAADWRAVIYGEIPSAEMPDEDRPFIAAAKAILPEEPFGETTWTEWTSQLKAQTGRKGKALFLPLRRALTGLDHGPELALVLPLIRRTRALERLTAAAQPR